MTRKDIQFIAICVGAIALVLIAAHLLWPRPPAEPAPEAGGDIIICRGPWVRVSEYAYLASVNSEVFHKPNCTWAKKIKEKNLICFKSREDAAQTGRKPCKVCRPDPSTALRSAQDDNEGQCDLPFTIDYLRLRGNASAAVGMTERWWARPTLLKPS